MRDFSRQSFLGPTSQNTLEGIKVGLVGGGGGGSHIAQQLAHIGVLDHVIADHDIVEEANLNRLVGATARDVKTEKPKVEILSRLIRRVSPTARIQALQGRWQDHQICFRDCSVIFGCVDSFAERDELERFCRRFLIVYIDIGMDVIAYPEGNRIVGQVVQSFPGAHCLRCLGIINDHKLALEAKRYGAAGGRAQVVWSNGVLASTAISVFMRLVTDWGPKRESVYLEYNGNDSILNECGVLKALRNEQCRHYDGIVLGDSLFAKAA